MAVLVTKPSPDGEMLCESIASKGVRAIHRPLIKFVQGENSGQLSEILKNSDYVIAVSKPSVEWANAALQSQVQLWPKSVCYLAIGQKTADRLKEVTDQKVYYPRISDSEHFLQLSPLLEVKNAKVTILRGNGGRELIHDVLIKRGARVEYCEVYQRQKLLFDRNSSIKNWQQNKVTHIVLTSGEQLNYFFSALPEREREWVCDLMLIVPSQRVANMAHKLGFYKVTVSGSASNPDLAAVIQQQCTIGQRYDE